MKYAYKTRRKPTSVKPLLYQQYQCTRQYLNDEDGNRIKSVLNGVTTYDVGNYFEWTGSNSRTGTPRRIAARHADGLSSTGIHARRQWQNRGAVLSSDVALDLYFHIPSLGCGQHSATSTLTYLHADHLGSASLATCGTPGGCSGVPVGGKVSEMRYYPYGETRSGTIATDRRYTGQRQESGLGLYFYNARYYDPALSRFISPDSMVPAPQNPQSLNRYSYVLNSPLRYTDPSGHKPIDDPEVEDRLATHFVYFTRTDLGELAQYQGNSTNDCGPTSQAVAASIRFHAEGRDATLDAASHSQNLQDRSRTIGFSHYRLTGFASFLANIFTLGKAGDIKGATSPQGMVNAYNDFAKQAQNLGFPDIGQAEYRNHGTKADLINNVKHDYITGILLVWQGGGAHWVNIVGYNAKSDMFYILDPGAPINANDPAQNVYEISWADLQKDWERPLLGYEQAMVTYK